MSRLPYFFIGFLFLLIVSLGCNKREKAAEPMPTCSEDIPACLPTTNCTEEVIPIPDLPAPLSAVWFNSKMGYLKPPTRPDFGSVPAFVREAFVIRSRQEVETLLQMPDSPLLKLDFCQYTALVMEVYPPVGCVAITEQSVTKRCDQYIFTAKFKPVGGCPAQWQRISARYYVVVPRLSKCAEVEFNIIP